MAKDYIRVYRSLMRRPLLLPDAPGISVVHPLNGNGQELI
jgi:hypothetical protein